MVQILFHLPVFPLGTISVPGLCVNWYDLSCNSKTNNNQERRRKKRKKKKEKYKEKKGKKW
jgi:hypothetical protein